MIDLVVIAVIVATYVGWYLWMLSVIDSAFRDSEK